MQRRDLGAHLHPQLGVEVRERLVHQEDARLADDRAPHRDALTLSTGQLARAALEVRLEAEHLGDLVHPTVAFCLRHARDAQRKGDVGRDREVRIERVVLEDHRDVTLLRREIGHLTLADPDAARVDLLEPGEHAQRCRLSGARRADEHEELAVGDLESSASTAGASVPS